MTSEQFKRAIYLWVLDNFGETEAKDPSWNINELANHLAIKQRLEELRQALHQENISYSETLELQTLKNYIEDDDVELLEAAGVVEGSR